MLKSPLLVTLLVILWIVGCATPVVHHAAFGEIDQDESGIIEWYEFKAAYPEASPKSFFEADLDKNGEISPEEWEAYMEDYPPEEARSAPPYPDNHRGIAYLRCISTS